MSRAGRVTGAARPAGGGGKNSQLDWFLLRIVDGGMAGCVFLVPLLMGGRQALGQLALVSLAVVVAVAWTLRQCMRREFCWRHSSAEVLLLAGVVLLLVQMVPLPQSILAWVAPRTAEVLPLWTAQGEPAASLGTWSCVSMTPGATRAALSLFLAYGLLFLVTVQRIRVVEDVERLLRWIALSAVLMASFGLLQLLTSNGKFFWFYEHPFSDTSDTAKGSFTNRNHFAHFLALGIGPVIWWLQDNLARWPKRRPGAFGRLAKDFWPGKQVSGFRSVALGTVLFAGLLSLSRGGVLVIFLAAAICVAVCYRAKTLGIRFVVSLGAVALLIGALLMIDGYDRVSDRLGELSSGSIETLDQRGGRRTIWGAVVKAIPDYALLGSGVGSHREVYPMYLENPPPTEYTHAENGPLQVLLESGGVGLALVLAGIGLCGFWCIHGLRRANSGRMLVCVGAISASLAVSVVHSLADFVWYVPACMALVALLAGCACRTWQLAGGGTGKQVRPVALPGHVGLAAALVLLVVGAWMVTNRVGPTLAEPYWDRYRIMVLASSRPGSAKREQQTTTTPGQVDEASLEALTRMVGELEQVVGHDPDNARAHLELAGAYLRRFDLAQQSAENAMTLADIRDAAVRARSLALDEKAKREVEDWLSRTISGQGDCLKLAARHTRQGLALCPLQGEGYLYLAELCFLERPGAEAARPAYVDQALRVRPFDGAVLFVAGWAAWLAGDAEQGTDYWQRSFRSGYKHQERLINALAGRMPVEYILRTYQPDLHGLRLLHASYGRLGQPDELDRLCWYYCELCRAERLIPGGAEDAKAWFEDQLAQLRRCYARAAQTEAQGQAGEEAAKTWMEARRLYRLLGDPDHELVCAQNASRCDPGDYRVRHVLASCLVEQEQFAAAEQHLNWCLQRRPTDEKLQKMVREVVKKRIDNEGRTVRSDNTPSLLR